MMLYDHARVVSLLFLLSSLSALALLMKPGGVCIVCGDEEEGRERGRGRRRARSKRARKRRARSRRERRGRVRRRARRWRERERRGRVRRRAAVVSLMSNGGGFRFALKSPRAT